MFAQSIIRRNSLCIHSLMCRLTSLDLLVFITEHNHSFQLAKNTVKGLRKSRLHLNKWSSLGIIEENKINLTGVKESVKNCLHLDRQEQRYNLTPIPIFACSMPWLIIYRAAKNPIWHQLAVTVFFFYFSKPMREIAILDKPFRGSPRLVRSRHNDIYVIYYCSIFVWGFHDAVMI